MRIDIMVDLETLGTNLDSTVFQIGAVAFDIETGDILDTFEMTADIAKADKLNVTGGTLKWWVDTDMDLFRRLLNSGKASPEQMLSDFADWFHALPGVQKDRYLWGNGILFDNAILRNQLEGIGRSYPVYYRNDRDVRTIVQLAARDAGVTENEIHEKYRVDAYHAHNAIDDARSQVQLVVGCHKQLTS